MPLCGYRWSDAEGALRVDSTGSVDCYVAMWGNGSYCQKEWLGSLDRIMNETFGFVSQNIGGVLALMANRRVSISLPGAVQIFVSMWVQKEV